MAGSGIRGWQDESLEAEPSQQLEAGIQLIMRGPWQFGHGGLNQLDSPLKMSCVLRQALVSQVSA